MQLSGASRAVNLPAPVLRGAAGWTRNPCAPGAGEPGLGLGCWGRTGDAGAELGGLGQGKPSLELRLAAAVFRCCWKASLKPLLS